ncbi:MAG TPA: sugar transferase [Gemmatimonadales bacterium]|nr:sugar transferase [Gemmatimonadales bacterium]
MTVTTKGSARPARPRGAGAQPLLPGPRHAAVPRAVWMALDTLVAVGVLLGVLVLQNVSMLAGGIEAFLSMRITVKNLLLLGGFVAAWPLLFRACGLYQDPARNPWNEEVVQVAKACVIGGLYALAFAFTSASGAFDFGAVAWFTGGTIGLTLLARGALRALTQAATVPDRKVVIVGSGPRALRLHEYLKDGTHRCEVLGFVDTQVHPALTAHGWLPMGGLDELERILMRQVVDEVLIALPIHSHYAQIQRAIVICERVGVQATVLVDLVQSALRRPSLRSSGPVAMLTMLTVPDDYRLIAKRAFDLVAGTLIVMAVAPVMLAAALAVKLTSPGPVLFVQERYGLNRRRFRMYKFRSMVVDAEARLKDLEHLNEKQGPIFKIRNDPRLTPVGSFLRRTSIDELPQLFNVLKGDMSLVGPRPMSLRDVGLFSEAWLMRRFSVRPGITGLWQVSGRSNLAFEDWVALDLKYIDEWSLTLDFGILARTVPVVLRGTGAA